MMADCQPEMMISYLCLTVTSALCRLSLETVPHDKQTDRWTTCIITIAVAVPHFDGSAKRQTQSATISAIHARDQLNIPQTQLHPRLTTILYHVSHCI